MMTYVDIDIPFCKHFLSWNKFLIHSGLKDDAEVYLVPLSGIT